MQTVCEGHQQADKKLKQFQFSIKAYIAKSLKLIDGEVCFQ